MSPYNRELHPAEAALLRFFDAGHLPEKLREVSEPLSHGRTANFDYIERQFAALDTRGEA